MEFFCANNLIKKSNKTYYLGLTNTSTSNGTVQLLGPGNTYYTKGIFQYTFDLSNWENSKILTTGTTYNTITVPSGSTIYIRNYEEESVVINRSGYYYGLWGTYYYYFKLVGTYILSGNPLSLLYKNIDKDLNFNFPISSKSIYSYYYGFTHLFYNCSQLTGEIPKTFLSSNSLVQYCYDCMFQGCTGITGSIPELPATTLTNYCYTSMFQGCTGITGSIPNLPATTLANSCYAGIFSGCTGLTGSIPELPITTLTDSCYYSMFSGCTGLTGSIPELPATTLTTSCYYYMFSGCTGLTGSIPENLLPATTLTSSCYRGMFSGCTGLTGSIPENLLPATTLAQYCYSNMFSGCTGLTGSIPKDLLPAIELKEYCYEYMFKGCTKLTNICNLPATTLADYCYQYMFQNCTGLTTICNLPATILKYHCYYYMFSGCSFTYSTTQDDTNKYPWRMPTSGTGTSSSTDNYYTSKMNQLNTIYYLNIQSLSYNYFNIQAVEANSTIQLSKYGSPTDITLEYSTDKSTWQTYTFGDTITLTNVDDKVYFKNTSEITTNFSTYVNNYYYFTLTGNVSLNGDLTTLLNKYGFIDTIPCSWCFFNLFNSCTVISNIDNLVLPSTTLTDYCYNKLFNGCTGLTSIPEDLLPATTLAPYCYLYLFQNCTKLTNTCNLPATTLANYCYSYMFSCCISLTSLPKLSITTTANYCCECMFYKCKNLDISKCSLIDFKGTTIVTGAFNQMYSDCSTIKLSTTKTTECKYAYRIPSMGYTCTSVASSALSSMFSSTGGTFTGTPSANTTYYTNIYVPEPFNITVENDNTNITISKIQYATTLTLQYSKDYSTWTDVSFGTGITVNTGEKLYIKNASETTTNFSSSSTSYYNIIADNYFNANGDISFLLNKNGGVTTIPCNYCFCRLFYNSTYLKSISNIDLSFTTLSNGCYYGMFQGCTGLTTIPENLLPVTTLINYCYDYMFDGCISLTNVCNLPATNLAPYCYQYMFNGCTSLTSLSKNLLSATILAENCYAYMFQNCTSLTNLPDLPASSFPSSCYYYMFCNCSNVYIYTSSQEGYTNIWRLPANTTGGTRSQISNSLYMLHGTSGSSSDNYWYAYSYKDYYVNF